MKKPSHFILPATALYFCGLAIGQADPQLDSWFTENTGKYARVYKRLSNNTPDLTTTYTTWGANGTEQNDPVYADIQRIQYSSGSVYVEASGLASYVMGPWYKPNGAEYNYWPVNQQLIFRIPRTTSVGTAPLDTLGGGYAGVFVNGMAAYGPLDGKAWETTDIASGQHVTTESDYYWFRLAPVAEGFNFDAGNGHQPPTGIYHSHQSPIALRYQLGDHVDYDAGTNIYSEKAGTPTSHSPILGWAKDGYPIYGPYGYDDPNDTGSGIRRMVSGFVERDGNNGSDGVGANRTTIPLWYARFRQSQGLDGSITTDSSAAAYGERPTLATESRGTFAQDFSYLGDLTNPADSQAYVQGEDFDLNEQNCRWCKTPEFPSGTYAYFVTIDSAGEPVFPYVLGFEYFGDTSNQYGSVDSISESVSTHYVGGPNADLDLETPTVDSSDDEVTLTWNIVEGGTYTVESSSDASSWNTENAIVATDSTAGTDTFTGNGGDGYARVTRSSIATYDAVLTSAPSSMQADTEAYTTPASVVYVNAARTGEATQDGTSWTTAFADLQDALATAITGQEIWVAAGVYYPDEAEAGVATVTADSSNSRFNIASDVPVYGGFAGGETSKTERDWSSNLTILSGDLQQNDTTINGIVQSDPSVNITGTNSKWVVYAGNDLSGYVDGFVVTAASGGDAPLVGGGTFRNCTIQGNSGYAGAIYQEGEMFRLISCDILNNEGRNVGAISAYGLNGVHIISCRIMGNKATTDNSNVSVGAIHAGDNNGDVQITNCLITGNSGYLNGAIVNRNSGTLRIDNSTIANNYARSADNVYSESGGVGSDAGSTNYFDNVLIWGNEKNGVSSNVNGEQSYDYCLIEGVDTTGGDGGFDGSASNDPLFLSPVSASSAPTSAGDYRLLGNSPAVEKGDAIENPSDTGDLDQDGNASEILPLDLVGNSREIGETDIGAFEYSGPVLTAEVTSNIKVQTISSGSVKAVDLDGLFGGDYNYSVVVHTAGVFGGWDVDGTAGTFDLDAPFGVVGSTTDVTVTATDADGYQLATTFTIEIVEQHTPEDGLSQSLASWFTERSSRFARIYEERTDETAQTSVTTWDNGFTAQTAPVFAGPQEVSNTDSFVFVKTPNLSTHIMGPWYNNTGPGGAEEVFQNWPTNQSYTFKIPREPTIPTTKTDLPPAAIGLMVDGTVIFSTTDTFSWDNDEDGSGNGSDTGPGVQGGGNGDGIWLHEAVVTEGNTFDKSNAHAAIDVLHYHGSPTGLRHLLGDNMNYDASTNTYTPVMEGDAGFNGAHSPILGWMNDGLPLYGPFGFSHPNDATSGVRRMVSGFLKRDGSDGSFDLNASGRIRLPQWVADARGVSQNLSLNEKGPDVSADYPIGYFMEDYAFKGDLEIYQLYQGVGAFDASQHYDLNEYNVRFCVTPEFPNGTWAYFTNVDSSGAPVFPYNVAQQYFGDPSNGGTVTSIPTNDGANEVKFDGGGVNLQEANQSVVIESGELTLTWSAVEGGTYTIESSTTLAIDDWEADFTGQVATTDSISMEDILDSTKRFYRITRTADPTYDGSGSGGAGAATNEFTFGTTPPLPPEGDIDTATVGGVAATIVSYDAGSGAVQLEFDDSTLSSGNHTAQLTFVASGGPQAGNTIVLTSTNSYTK